ncbi:hypothetical protein ACNFU2_20585 [Chryseobacterium sp. PTM-20240506]|uniref:hypothetical protein n=1 Tax=unclassified Chryseobacterium TaxID=2593645 RepID=UPI002358A5AC|nr:MULTISPECIES: hypothetical protein [unclassified Chryseobacterium]MDC8102986.1 hypothetical protein [Chryseobacterium sp. B21-037]MDQ1802534.1 hypothetical protein [Chryseobacterium sp. CKR4-1]
MNYYVNIHSDTSEFFEGNKLILKVIFGRFYLNKNKILGVDNKELLVFKTFNFFFKKNIKILDQNLDKTLSVKRNSLVINNNILSIKEKFNILGKYEAICLLNNKKIGSIKDESTFFMNKYVLVFDREDEYNYYFLLLFAMLSVGFADPA